MNVEADGGVVVVVEAVTVTVNYDAPDLHMAGLGDTAGDDIIGIFFTAFGKVSDIFIGVVVVVVTAADF